MLPVLDIGMEYYYRKIFKEKLRHLYGFDYDKAQKFLNNNKNFQNLSNDKASQFTEDDFNARSSNIKLEESKIETEIDEEVTNTGRNTGSIIRGAGEIGKIVIKTAGAMATEAGTIAVEAGTFIASLVLLPVTCIAFGTWSCVNVHKDCHKILDIFDAAFTPLRFETLFTYIQSFRAAINYLENIVQKIIEDDEKENEND